MHEATYRVEVQPDFIQKLSRVSPVTALAELVWNALDADSTTIEVVLDEAEFGHERLSELKGKYLTSLHRELTRISLTLPRQVERESSFSSACCVKLSRRVPKTFVEFSHRCWTYPAYNARNWPSF